MIISKVIQRIQSLYSKGVQSRASRLESRHIYNKLLTVRARLISQKSNKREKINTSFYQILDCINMIRVSKNECYCNNNSDCYTLRSEFEIPSIINDNKKHMISSVTAIDDTVVFSETNALKKKYANGSKYTKRLPEFFIKNNYLYITNNNIIEKVFLTAIFTDPLSVYNYEDKCQNDCVSNLDRDFHTDDSIIENIIRLSVEELLQMFNNNKEDLRNNTQDNPVNTAK